MKPFIKPKRLHQLFKSGQETYWFGLEKGTGLIRNGDGSLDLFYWDEDGHDFVYFRHGVSREDFDTDYDINQWVAPLPFHPSGMFSFLVGATVSTQRSNRFKVLGFTETGFWGTSLLPTGSNGVQHVSKREFGKGTVIEGSTGGAYDYLRRYIKHMPKKEKDSFESAVDDFNYMATLQRVMESNSSSKDEGLDQVAPPPETSNMAEEMAEGDEELAALLDSIL